MSVVKTKNASLSVNHKNLTQKYLTFLLANKLYAFSILKVKEIIEYGTVTPIPTMPSFICGAINIRGGAVPVIDLLRRLEGSNSEIGKRSCIVIVELAHEDGNVNIGVIVDSVNRVMDFNTNDIEPAPTFGGAIRTDFIEGMGKSDEDFIIILNIDSILSMEDLDVLMKSNSSLHEKPEGAGETNVDDVPPVLETETAQEKVDETSATESSDILEADQE